MKDTYKQAQMHIKTRSDGMFVVFDKDQRQRYKAPTREEAKRWIDEHTPARRAAHVLEMGES